MDVTTDEVIINGIKYLKEGTVPVPMAQEKGLDYVIVRTYSAGAHAGYLQKRKGKEVHLCDSRRLWYWDVAASLSQLAVDGTSKPQNCKFPCAVPQIILTEAIEIIPCTKKAQTSIEGVPIWSK